MHSVSFWIERDQKVHKQEWRFMSLSPLLAEIKYPVDLFVRFQPNADEVGVPDWDPEQYELFVFWVADARAAHSYRLRDDIALGGAAHTRIMALGVEELKAMLEAMDRRDWNDIVYARERGPTEQEDGEDNGEETEARGRGAACDVMDIIVDMENMGI